MKPTGREGPWVAAVDIGSVSCQLVLTNGVERVRRSIDTLLGGATMAVDGTVRPAPFDPDALAATEAALGEFAELTGNADAAVRVVATAAARRATNADDLARIVERSLGVRLEVLDAADEGRLAFAGAICSDAVGAPEGDDPVLTIDVGGGSTEFTLGNARDGTLASVSIPLGGALVTAAYLHGDPPGPDELSAALSVVELHLDDVLREMPALAPALESVTAIGLGAVVTSGRG